MNAIAKKQRQSNIELLRIISMVLVMVLHVNFFALGYPTEEEFSNSPAGCFTRILFQMISIGSVNTFVLISGWFGIHPTMKGLVSFLFQCIFFFYGIFIAMILLGKCTPTFSSIEVTLFFKSWFIQNYLILFFVAPAINVMLEKMEKSMFAFSLFGLFAIELVYDFLSFGERLFGAGYSALHFIFLYMLAGYVKKYGSFGSLRRFPLTIFFTIVFAMTFIVFMGYCRGIEAVMRMNCYTNPLVILSSLSLLLFFSNIRFQSSIINWIAKSTFAIYLVHTNMYLMSSYYVKFSNNIYNEYSSILYLILMAGYLGAWFMAAILLDKIRLYLWNRINQIKLISK